MRPVRWTSFLVVAGAFGVLPLGAQPFARLVADLNAGTERLDTSDLAAQLTSFQPAGGRALFLAYQREGAACGLWSSDGSAAGTGLLADLCSDPSEDPPAYTAEAMGSDGRIGYYRDARLRLWRSDGTEAGTFLLASNMQVSVGVVPRVTPDGRFLLFQGCTVQDGCELWRSDGTRAGTKAVFSLYPGAKGGGPRELVFGAGRLFFLAGATGERAAIFEADASGLGAVRRMTFGPGSLPQRLVPSDSKLFYLAVARGSFGDFHVGSIALRAEKGAAEGGAEAEEGASPDRVGVEGRGGAHGRAGAKGGVAPGKTPIHPISYFGLTALADRLYFIVSDIEAEIAMWESDGTDRGTHVVPAGGSSNGPNQLRAMDGRILFLVSDDYPESRCSLWSLVPGDGSVHEVARGIEGSCLDDLQGSLTAFRGRIYFVVGDYQNGLALWNADPRRGNPRKVLDLCPGGCGEAVPSLRTVGDSLLVTDSSAGLWRIGGPGEEPLRLAAVGPAAYGFYGLDLAFAAGRLYFQGYDPLHLLQPWVSDFTPRGTRMAALAGPFAAGSAPAPLLSLGERAVFGACTGEGAALFASGGEAPVHLGALLPDCSFFPFFGGLRVGPLAYIQSFTESQSGIVRTDGTPAGTFPLDPPDLGYVRQLAEIRGRLVFTADERDPDAIGSLAFWTSDGTLEGTRRLFHLALGGSPIAADDSRGLLLFIAQEPESPFYYRLFGSDGTEAGTHRLLRVNLGSSFYPFLHPALVNGLRFFFVDPLDEVERVELWSTDGTPEGTRAVEPADGVHPAAPFDLMAFDSGLYFFADAEAGTNPGRALWRSDGTPGSTRLFAHLAPPREQGFEVSSQPTVLHGRLYFVADDGQAGAELWSTDGTPEGTKIVLDLRPGPRGARIAHLTAAGGRLYFSADDGLAGRELWTSDGTAEGTHLVQDLAPGGTGSSPGPLAALDGGLLFSADDGQVGREPWFLSFGPGAACQAAPGVLCLDGGRYRVEADYRAGAGWAPAEVQPLGEAGARFSFSGPEGLDAAVRLGGGEAHPGAKPVFVAGLTTQEHMVTVTDGRTGRARRYANPPGSAGSLADLAAFPADLGLAATAEPFRDTAGLAPRVAALSPSACSPSPSRLCLLGGRFQVEVSYGPAGRRSAPGKGLSDATASFDLDPFARPGVLVKLVDGQAVNGRFWLFAGSLTQRPYSLKVTDTATGAVRTYTNQTGRSRSVADTHAF